MPSKQEHKVLLDQLRLKFPHLRDEIAEARDAIFHAHSLIEKHKKNPKKAAEAIKHMARTRVLPVEIARHFLNLLIEPLEPMGMIAGGNVGLNVVPIRAVGRSGGTSDNSRESAQIVIAVENMGFKPQGSLNWNRGIVGKKIKVTPVRIGMPGTPEEGTVFGLPKNDTRYPINEIKVIQEKDGNYYVGMFSSKAGNKAITWRGINVSQSAFDLPAPIQSSGNTALVPYRSINIPPGTRVIPSRFSAPGDRRETRALPSGRNYNSDDVIEGEIIDPETPSAREIKLPRAGFRNMSHRTQGKFSLDISWSPPGAGKTTPDRGRHTYKAGEVVECVAQADQGRGYSFDYWILNGKAIRNPGRTRQIRRIRITMNQNHTLMAVFRGEPGAPRPNVLVPLPGSGGGAGIPAPQAQPPQQAPSLTHTVTVLFNPAPPENPGNVFISGRSFQHQQSRQYNHGQQIQLAARTNRGNNNWRFTHFEIFDPVYPNGLRIIPNPYLYNVNSGVDIVAHFEGVPTPEQIREQANRDYFPPERPTERPLNRPGLFGFRGPSTRTSRLTPQTPRLVRARRILAARANRFYRDHRDQFERQRQALRDARRELDRTRRGIQRRLKASGRRQQAGQIAGVLRSENPLAMIRQIATAVGTGADADTVLQTDITNLATQTTEYIQLRRDVEREIRTDFPRDLRARLEAAARSNAGEIATELRVTDPEAGRIRDILMDYVEELIDHYNRRAQGEVLARLGRGVFGSAALGGSQRTSEVVRNIFVNWWGLMAWPLINLFFPPLGWIALIIWALLRIPLASSIIVLWIQVGFLVGGTILGLASLPGYAGATTLSTILVLGLIGGILNWMMNMKTPVSPGPLFEGTPFGEIVQQFSHIVAGAMIFIGVGMFTIALQLGLPSLVGIGVMAGVMLLFTFLLPPEYLAMLIVVFAIGAAFVPGLGAATALYGIFVIMGMTNFYPASGLNGINVIAIAVIIFAYLAIGPYSAQIVDMTSQLKAPLNFVVDSSKIAFSDAWLLLTNPTAYLENQQLRQVRSERPISFPEAVEITRIETVPEGTVRAEQDFVIFAVIENKGDMVARDVKISARCIPGVPATAVCEATVTTRCDSGETFDAESIPCKNLGELDPHEVKRVEFRFKSKHRSDAYGSGQSRRGETVINKVNLSLHYSYNTSSRLQVEVADDEEVQRRQLNSEPVFIPIPAVGKVGPAQLSLFVGPQPLVYDAKNPQPALLIAAVSNSRPDAEVIVYSGIPWDITLSPDIGTNLKCSDSCASDPTNTNSVRCSFSKDDVQGAREERTEDARRAEEGFVDSTFSSAGDAIDYLVYFGNQPDERTDSYHIIRPYKYRDYWVQVCQFDMKSVTGSRTGIVISTLENYIVRVNKEMSINVGPPLGISTEGDIEGPMAPSELAATLREEGLGTDVMLRWQDNSDNEAGFYVYKLERGDTGFKKIATLSASEIQYEDNTGEKGHQYVVSAYNTGGEARSNQAGAAETEATEEPLAPIVTHAIFDSTSEDETKVEWTATSPDAEGFIVRRKRTTEDEFKVIAVTEKDKNENLDEDDPKLGDVYIVTATNSKGESEIGSEAVAAEAGALPTRKIFGYTKYKQQIKNAITEENFHPKDPSGAEYNEFAIVSAIIKQESVWAPNAKSYTGVRGLMQITRGTWKAFCGNDIGQYTTDTAQVIRCGVRILKHTFTLCKGGLPEAASSYNAGTGSTKGCTAYQTPTHWKYQEAKTYEKRVTSYYSQYNAKIDPDTGDEM